MPQNPDSTTSDSGQSELVRPEANGIEHQKMNSQYNETFIAALQWLWGEGNLAPGGTDDLIDMLGGVDASGMSILDVGCGLGAIAIELAKTYRAARVVGVDVEPHLIEYSRARAKKANVDDKVSFELVTPGPLPFEDSTYDIVVTKDAIVHIPDKARFYKDVLRVLRPGGVFVGSDWLRGGEGAGSNNVARWLEIVHLDFQMQNLRQTKTALQRSGFDDIRLTDRNAWYKEEIKLELATLVGEKYDQLVQLIGVESARHRLESSRLKQLVVEEGFLRPTHFYAIKP